MQPARKRRIRLVVALSAAVMLAVALVYTSISASSKAVSPSQLTTAQSGVAYQLTGKVQDGSVRMTRDGEADPAFAGGLHGRQVSHPRRSGKPVARGRQARCWEVKVCPRQKPLGC